ncbi:hypothetical protein [Phenylobacterium sp.]|uniref:hypothetical protein n=1 Tax=Phenylobacterium sp. TaxID=1871053 RepID=UPI002F929705
MKHVLIATLAAALAAGAAQAQDWKAPRTPFGQPDLQGYWSNSTLTPMTRRPELGERLTFTPEEVKKLEQAVVEEVEAGNKPTDPNAPVNAPNGLELRPEFAAAGGDVGGYNRGWLDPGHQVMRVAGQPRTSLLTTKNGQPPPRRNGVATNERYGGGLGSFDNPENRPLGERCVIGFGRNAGPPMFPNGFYNNNYHIVQTPDAVAILVEMAHDTRVVRLNAKHRTDGVRPYFGDSIGWWDGDTLVVETTHIPEAQAFMGSWKDLKVTERFTRASKNRLRYQFKVEDPTAWNEPWGGEYEFSPLEGVIYEYACHEGNYALPGILAGARLQEKERAEAAPKAAGGR